MPLYICTVITKDGRSEKHFIEAASEEDARILLEKQKYFTADIKEIRPGTGNNEEEVISFTRELATYLQAGIPLAECLNQIALERADTEFGAVLAALATKVEGGQSLSAALSSFAHLFGRSYIDAIGAGERVGGLVPALKRLEKQKRQLLKLSRRMKEACAYPTLLLFLAFAMTGYLFFFVIPTFKRVFDDLGARLPLYTSLLLDTSLLLRENFPLVFTIALTAFLLVLLRAKKKGREILHHLPFLGPIARLYSIADFSSTLSLLLSSGIPVDRALEISSRSMPDSKLRIQLDTALSLVRGGHPLSEALHGTIIAEPFMINMVRAGERAGNLAETLESALEFYEEELESRIATLSKMVEPLLLLFMGTVIGLIILAIFLPVVRMTVLV